MVTIAVTTEPEGEPRVALSPETARKLVGLGCRIRVASGAGQRSRFADHLYKAQGAEIADSDAAALIGGDILLKVRRPSLGELKVLKPGTIVAAMLDPYSDLPGLEAAAATGTTLFSMEFMPRIT